MLSRRDFEKLLLQAVDEGLSSLGQSSKQSIYFHLDKNFNIKRQQIPTRIKDFENAVETIFGLGANFLEIAIMKQLHEKVGQEAKWHLSNDLTFSKYVDTVKRSYLKKSKSRKATGRMMQCGEILIKV
jgi:hypothetical protein